MEKQSEESQKVKSIKKKIETTIESHKESISRVYHDMKKPTGDYPYQDKIKGVDLMTSLQVRMLELNSILEFIDKN